MSEATKQGPKYTHGHHASVLRSHKWRNAKNSAGYLLPHIRPDSKILDVGCGPGTITVDLGHYVPQGSIIGIDPSASVVEQAKEHAAQAGSKNVTFDTGDIYNLSSFADASFDIVHAHQVLQHVHDPVRALKEMKRLTKPGGIVACQESDYTGFTWYPEVEGMDYWKDLYIRVARGNGGEPNAGRMIHAWARQAGLDPDKIEKGSGTWCYSSPSEIQWWSDLWAERTIKSQFAESAINDKHATQQDLENVSQTWRKWGESQDPWFSVLLGNIICKV